MRDADLPLTRRELLGSGIALSAVSAPAFAATDASPGAAGPPRTVSLSLTVNGVSRIVEIDPRATLLDTLRESMDLCGTKKGCDQGQCGACTVHVEGRRVLACLTLAQSVVGRSVTTIEGLAAPDGTLDPMQQAFLDHDALQCGYCTPGQIMSAVACVREGHAGSDEDIREYMSGNLCRCGAYKGIVAAVRFVARGIRS